jgi:hypothetical protein
VTVTAYVLFDDGTIKTGRWSTYRHEEGGRWVWSDVNLENIALATRPPNNLTAQFP